MKPMIVAAVGDVHGHMHAMVRLLQAWERRSGRAIDLVLQVGDFEAHRDEADLATMAAPAKYRKLGDFAAFYSGPARMPWPLYFIGGNHEPYGYLDTVGAGALTKNVNYMGRVGVLERGGLRIAGLSAIFRPELLTVARPGPEEIGQRSNKAYIGFTETEVDAVLALERVDVLLLHDWPAGLVRAEEMPAMRARAARLGYDEIGNDYARLVIEALRPRLVLCGHMHTRHRATIEFGDGGQARVCCLSEVAAGADAIAVFEVDGGSVREIGVDGGPT